MENTIFYHADDYGVTYEQCKKILECNKQGALNSISVIPNVKELDKALGVLEEVDCEHAIRRVLHLNFVEGRPVADIQKVKLLVDDKGYFDKSFVKLLIWSYTKLGNAREQLKSELKEEIKAQIETVMKKYDFDVTAIDSHQHYHIIPIVFECLMEVLQELEKESTCNVGKIRQIRVPVDPLYPIFHVKGMLWKVPAVNWIKWFILKFNSYFCVKQIRNAGYEIPVFFGILFTCEMKKDVVFNLLGQYRQYAEKKNEKLELMFHPGNLSAKYELLDERKKELEEFYMSDNRFLEAQCLFQLKSITDVY